MAKGRKRPASALSASEDGKSPTVGFLLRVFHISVSLSGAIPELRQPNPRLIQNSNDLCRANDFANGTDRLLHGGAVVDMIVGKPLHRIQCMWQAL